MAVVRTGFNYSNLSDEQRDRLAQIKTHTNANAQDAAGVIPLLADAILTLSQGLEEVANGILAVLQDVEKARPAR